MARKLVIGSMVGALLLASVAGLEAQSQGMQSNGTVSSMEDEIVHPRRCFNMKQIPPEKIIKFKEENRETIERIKQLRTEMRNIACSQKPNWNEFLEKEKEIMNLRLELQRKAISSGLPPFVESHILHMGYGSKVKKGPKGPMKQNRNQNDQLKDA
ncbi:MAG: hypothetical protein ACPLSJ_02245 [Thermosulfidibacteraceae bacterium]|jgi:hypothetical protein